MSGARSTFMGGFLALGVAVAQEGLVRLVEASGAKDQPAVVLILLLAAFLGLLTAVVVRAMRLQGAIAPTALVLGWIVVPPEDPQKGGVFDVRSGAPGKASGSSSRIAARPAGSTRPARTSTRIFFFIRFIIAGRCTRCSPGPALHRHSSTSS